MKAKKPNSKRILNISAIVDHRPVDGPIESHCVCLIEDGSWDFIWNLRIIANTINEHEKQLIKELDQRYKLTFI